MNVCSALLNHSLLNHSLVNNSLLKPNILLIFLINVLCFFPFQSTQSAEAVYPFERIFTLKNERRVIDRRRLSSNQNGIKTSNAKMPEIKIQALQEGHTSQVKFSGYMTKQDGSKVYWVDGITELGDSAKDIKVENRSNKIVFTTQHAGVAKRRAVLKAGQVWLVEKEKIIENYEIDTLTPKQIEKQDLKKDDAQTE